MNGMGDEWLRCCLFSWAVLIWFFVFFDLSNGVYLDNFLCLVGGYIDDDGVYGIVY